MGDIADRAALTIAQQTDEGLYHMRQALQAKGCKDCKDCDEPIPDSRRASVPSAQRCIDCQKRHEVKAMRFSGRR